MVSFPLVLQFSFYVSPFFLSLYNIVLYPYKVPSPMVLQICIQFPFPGLYALLCLLEPCFIVGKRFDVLIEIWYYYFLFHCPPLPSCCFFTYYMTSVVMYLRTHWLQLWCPYHWVSHTIDMLIHSTAPVFLSLHMPTRSHTW